MKKNVNNPAPEVEEDEVIEGQGDDNLDDEQELEAEEAEENEDDSEKPEAEPEQPKRVITEQDLLHKARRESFRHLRKINELEAQLALQQEEMAKLRYVNNVTTQTAFSHYEAAAKEKLDRARDMKKTALESGDPETIAATDEVLYKAAFEHERLRAMKAEEEARLQNEYAIEQARQQAQMYHQPSTPGKPNLSPENFDTANSWVKQNDWFKTDSPNYDYDKHMLANNIMDNLDNWCYQNNQSHLIGSDQYFNQLDQYMEQFTQMPPTNQINPRPQTQAAPRQGAPVRSMVAPSRSAHSMPNGAPQRSQASPLSGAERQMARNLGVSEAEFRKHKARSTKSDYMNDQINQMRERGGY